MLIDGQGIGNMSEAPEEYGDSKIRTQDEDIDSHVLIIQTLPS